MINRKLVPKLNINVSLPIIKPKEYVLSNSNIVYYLDKTKEKVISISLLFPAGIIDENKRLVSAFLEPMLLEGGSQNYSAKEFLEIVNLHAIQLSTSSSRDSFSIDVSILKSKFSIALKLLSEMIFNPIFSQNELDKIKKEKIENYNRSLVYPTWTADKLYAQALYGDTHPYGYFQTINDYKAITREDLVEFHSAQILNARPQITMVGQISTKNLEEFNKVFGNKFSSTDKFTKASILKKTATNQKLILKEREQSVQSSIVVYKLLDIDYTHPDYYKLLITNFIFGGSFFNARLMQKIREEKGYTYGIYSKIVSNLFSNEIVIKTDVAIKFTKDTLSEIASEMKLLQTKDIPQELLNASKIVLKSRIAQNLDGKYAQIDQFGYYNFLRREVNENFRRYFAEIDSITSLDIKHIAQKYFNFEDFCSVVVGALN